MFQKENRPEPWMKGSGLLFFYNSVLSCEGAYFLDAATPLSNRASTSLPGAFVIRLTA